MTTNTAIPAAHIAEAQRLIFAVLVHITDHGGVLSGTKQSAQLLKANALLQGKTVSAAVESLAGLDPAENWTVPLYPGDAVRIVHLQRGEGLEKEIGDIRIQQYLPDRFRIGSFVPGNLIQSPGDSPKVEPEESAWRQDAGEANIQFAVYLEAALADGWKRLEVPG